MSDECWGSLLSVVYDFLLNRIHTINITQIHV